jgi:hypothetical protein
MGVVVSINFKTASLTMDTDTEARFARDVGEEPIFAASSDDDTDDDDEAKDDDLDEELEDEEEGD